VPTLIDGCYTGQCRALESCDVNPVCSHLNTESSCVARTDCKKVTNGINCTKSDGTACQDGDVGCTCQSYPFASCTTL
jgi:hypothetical protein